MPYSELSVARGLWESSEDWAARVLSGPALVISTAAAEGKTAVVHEIREMTTGGREYVVITYTWELV